MINQQSYKAHEEHIHRVSAELQASGADFSLFQESSLGYFIHRQFWQLTDALARPGSSWLTVGDLYGADAAWFQRRGCEAMASDLTDSILGNIQKAGLINRFSVENVEKLSFGDNSFDYVFCKEAYHHFPRPAIGFYEMLRVCREAVVIQEPVDPVIHMPLLLFLRNILDRIDTGLMRRLWKNQYSFEPVGNYVHKISVREFEKMACSLGLPMLAYRGFNPGNVGAKATIEAQKKKIAFRDFLTATTVVPPEALSVIVFKRKPTGPTLADLEKQGYKLLDFPKNPYL
ncbi:class I SAM-dependent methyltransferase [Tellurirhabdus rosea]|uniref:class I SAM-dependent methyltransferase n=1 Tax=Tellurirhabdus rosea TaxID=2674997 RepID=UPI00224E7FDE|nr:methyltransferase domain-containing protein [Tellurirhabdus rosea]